MKRTVLAWVMVWSSAWAVAAPPKGAAVKAAPPAGAPTENAWAASAKARGYPAAAAHDPRFDDQALWGRLTGKEQFTKATWQGGSTLVWAHPGDSSVGHKGAKGTTHDPFDPASWRDERGRPVRAVAFGPDTDVFLPDAAEPYGVNLDKKTLEAHGFESAFRHVTIGRHAHLQVGGDGGGRLFYGHVWVKQGGTTRGNGPSNFTGDQPTFFRNDNPFELPLPRCVVAHTSQYVKISKAAPASVEVLGALTMLDEFSIDSGALILAPGAVVQTGRRANPRISGGSTLAILDGAYFGPWQNNFNNFDLMVLDGTVSGGLPDRPLTQPAFLALLHKNHTQAPFPEAAHRPRMTDMPRVASLVILKGELTAHTSDPAKAPLVVTASNLPWSSLRLPEEEGEWKTMLRANPAEVKAAAAWFDTLPRGVAVALGRDVEVSNVKLDHLAPGGLVLADPAQQASWRNVSFGDHNAATGDALVTTATVDKSARY